MRVVSRSLLPMPMRLLPLVLLLPLPLVGLAATPAPTPPLPSQEFVLSRLFAATDKGPFVSYSWGEHWSPIRGSMRGFTGELHAFLCLGPAVYAAGSDGLFVSGDFGETYRRDRFPGDDVRGFLSSRLFALEPTLFVWTRTALYRTTDAGLDWRLIGQGALEGTVQVLDWPGPELIALTERGLYLSSDAGDRWAPLGRGLPGAGLLSLEVARYFALEPTMFVGTEGAGLYRSVDGGRTFEPLAAKEVEDATVRALYWWASLLIVGTDEGLLLSTDAGESFKGVPELEGLAIQVLTIPGADADVPSDIIVGTNAGVYKSSDGGGTFRFVDEGMGPASVRDLATFPITPQDRERKRR